MHVSYRLRRSARCRRSTRTTRPARSTPDVLKQHLDTIHGYLVVRNVDLHILARSRRRNRPQQPDQNVNLAVDPEPNLLHRRRERAHVLLERVHVAPRVLTHQRRRIQSQQPDHVMSYKMSGIGIQILVCSTRKSHAYSWYPFFPSCTLLRTHGISSDTGSRFHRSASSTRRGSGPGDATGARE